MRKIIILLFLWCIQMFLFIRTNAQAIETWNAYMAYKDIQQIAVAGDDIFVRASNGIFQYNKNDQSIITYDKVKNLSDTYITYIAWSKTAKRLIVVYQNSNIDLVETNGNVTNISDLYSKSMTEDKTVYGISIIGKYAYLGTGFGIVKVNMTKSEISESYIFNKKIDKVVIKDNKIIARQNKWLVMSASVNDNLLDKNNWKEESNSNNSIFNDDLTDYNTYLPTISALELDGPKSNTINFIKFHNGKLYTLSGLMGGDYHIHIYDGNKWNLIDESYIETLGHDCIGHYCLDIDPNDENHIAVVGQTGFYEFKDGHMINSYNCNNSILKTASTVGGNNPRYVIVTAVKFDNDGNIWLANSISPSTSLIKYTKSGDMISKHKESLMHDATRSFENMSDMMIDSRGLLWFVNDHWRSPSLVCYNMETDKITIFNNFKNQNGTSIGTITGVGALCEDNEGNIWIGTTGGPVYLNSEQMKDNNLGFTQYVVPRNDGTNLGDYLLSNVNISCIAIDGGGRKWFGTFGNGVYLISADNNTQIHHFTTENSALLSNTVHSIAINGKSGEVFFATENGLCSYMSNATTPNTEMTKDNVYAYPNPVRPEYTGSITVTGLTDNADVKITTSSGYLVAEGRSNGGTFVWDGLDKNGKRVASGIYMVQAATSEGEKGTVCKIAIIN